MLELDYSLEGVVFFNEDNKLIVRSRKGKDADCDFVSSPLRESLADKCAIYIDDEHTRGTDFKFPVGAVGCVTLGTLRTKLQIKKKWAYSRQRLKHFASLPNSRKTYRF